MDQIANVINAFCFQAVCRTHRQLQIIYRAQENRIYLDLFLAFRLGLFFALNAGFWSAVCIIISGPFWDKGWPYFYDFFLKTPAAIGNIAY